MRQSTAVISTSSVRKLLLLVSVCSALQPVVGSFLHGWLVVSQVWDACHGTLWLGSTGCRHLYVSHAQPLAYWMLMYDSCPVDVSGRGSNKETAKGLEICC